MRAVLLRTGSYAVQSPPVFPGPAQVSLYRHDSAPSLFSCERSSVNSPRTSLHLDINRRRDAPAMASGIRRAFSESDVIRSEVRFSRLTEAGSRSLPARIPEEEFLSESDDDGIGLLSTIDGIWPEIGIPVEEPSFPGDGFGRGGKNRGGGDGGNGTGNGEDRSKIGAYYLEMLKSNPGDSLLLRNYGKFLHEVVILSPARTATQQGSGKVGRWKINFMSTQKWENPLMGWTSTGDPYAHVGDSALSFDSEEAAKSFAERHGWDYVVKKRHTPLLKVKAYADNFKWKGLPKPEED